jgi:Fe-S oxidoreductase
MLSQQTLDQLIFLCPTCASTAKREWPRLLSQDSRLAQAANTLAAKVMDISEYLVKVVKISPPQGKVNCKVTYHDPCHLVRDLKIKDEPRQLINSIPGVEMVEMKEPDSCCGFGGSFSLFYYDLSRKINDDKVKQIMETGADYVVTGCPGCMVHLADGISHENGRQKPMHVIELLAKAYNQDGGENQ